MNAVKAFLKRKNVSLSPKTYFITAMGAMAQGLFASLLIGTIFKTVGDWLSFQFLLDLAAFAMNGYVCGAAIGFVIPLMINFVLYMLNDKLVTPDDVENRLGIGVIGKVPYSRKLGEKRV